VEGEESCPPDLSNGSFQIQRVWNNRNVNLSKWQLEAVFERLQAGETTVSVVWEKYGQRPDTEVTFTKCDKV